MSLESLLQSIQYQNEVKRQEDERRKANEPNIVGGITGALAGALTGGAAWIPMALAGGVTGAMSPKSGNEVMDALRGGLGGYQQGGALIESNLRKKYMEQLASPASQSEWTGAAMRLFPEEAVKGAFSKPLVNIGEGGDVQTKSMLDSLWTGQGGTGRIETLLKGNPKVQQALNMGYSLEDVINALLK